MKKSRLWKVNFQCRSVEFGMKYVYLEDYPHKELLKRTQKINFCFNLLSLAKALLKENNFAADIGARIFVHEAESFMECNLK